LPQLLQLVRFLIEPSGFGCFLWVTAQSIAHFNDFLRQAKPALSPFCVHADQIAKWHRSACRFPALIFNNFTGRRPGVNALMRPFLQQEIRPVLPLRATGPLRVLLLLTIFCMGSARAQLSQESRPGRPMTGAIPSAGRQGAATKPQSAANASNLALSITQMGAFRCVERADQVARFFSRGAGDIFIVDRPGPRPNADQISVTMIVNQGLGNYPTVDISLTPTANGCTAFYAASITAPESCEQAERTLYRGLTFKILRSGLPHRIATIGNEARVLSRPVPGGCLLTKSEVIR
jgi:hypothetical protein